MYLYPIALKFLPVNLTYILHCFPKAIFDFLYFSRDIGLQFYLNHSKIWRKNENRYKNRKNNFKAKTVWETNSIVYENLWLKFQINRMEIH